MSLEQTSPTTENCQASSVSGLTPQQADRYAFFSIRIDREWSAVLRPSEQSALRFILDRTLGVGHEWAHINASHLTERGVMAGEDYPVRPGCGLSLSTAQRSLRRLKDEGFIASKRVQDGWLVAINTNEKNAMLRYSEKRKEARERGKKTPLRSVKLTEQSGQIDHSCDCIPSNNRHSREENSTKEQRMVQDIQSRRSQNDQSPLASLDGVVRAAMQRSVEIRQKKEDSAGPGKRAKMLWLRVCMEVYGDPCRKEKDVVKLTAHCNRRAKHGQPIVEILEWSLRNWRQIIAQRFSWMKADRPDVPSIPVFVRFSEKFESAYREREEISKRAKMTPRERSIEQLMAKHGIDRETAERQIDERSGLTRERKRLELERKRLAAQQQVGTRVVEVPKTPEYLKPVSNPSTEFGEWED